MFARPYHEILLENCTGNRARLSTTISSAMQNQLAGLQKPGPSELPAYAFAQEFHTKAPERIPRTTGTKRPEKKIVLLGKCIAATKRHRAN